MGFPLVLKLVTLNDFERRNGCHFATLSVCLSNSC